MTIDEAIEKYNKLANNDRTCYPEEAQQLAEWLEELKVYQQHKIICNKGYNAGYNKAIDDFKEELFKNSERARPIGWLGYSEIVTCEKIYEIAEQLKAGNRNES